MGLLMVAKSVKEGNPNKKTLPMKIPYAGTHASETYESSLTAAVELYYDMAQAIKRAGTEPETLNLQS